MRHYLLIAAILFNATPVLAQSYQPYQHQPQPQQEANVTNYPAPPVSYPQQQPVYAAPQPVQPAQNYYDARPSDAGQSVVTDVRQMNF